MIGQLIRQKELDYTSGKTKLGKYVDISQYEIIENIIAYLNSKHLSGDKDSLGREKPFFNICVSAVNIWYRATDIDRKNIRVKATKEKDAIKSFIMSLLLQQWMRKSKFGMFLNDWGLNLARFGSAVVKFVEKGKDLNVSVIPFTRLITDPIDFENNPVIEKLYLSEAQLQANKAYDQEAVRKLITEKAKVAKELLGDDKVDTNAGFYEVYELHGNLPEYYLTDDEKDIDSVQQMHVVSFIKDKDGKYKDFSLYKGREAKSPYLLTHLIKEEGRTLGIGAVEYLFDAQWMVNHSIKTTKDILDMSSKIFFQTADPQFTGVNAINNLETGDILINDGNPLTQVNSSSNDTASLQNFNVMWQNLAKELTSTPDAIRGNNFPSGTAYKQVALLNQEANSLFELMTENKGLYLEEMLREHILPFLKKRMDTTEEISLILDAQNITKLDKLFIDAELIRRQNKVIKDAMFKKNGLGGEVAQPLDLEAEKQAIQSTLNETGNQRFIKPSDIDSKTWKEALDGIEWDLEVEITNETVDKQAVFDTLTTLFQVIAQSGGQPMSPEARLVFNKILEETGRLSAIEVASVNEQGVQKEQQNQQMTQNNPAELLNKLAGK